MPLYAYNCDCICGCKADYDGVKSFRQLGTYDMLCGTCWSLAVEYKNVGHGPRDEVPYVRRWFAPEPVTIFRGGESRRKVKARDIVWRWAKAPSTSRPFPPFTPSAIDRQRFQLHELIDAYGEEGRRREEQERQQQAVDDFREHWPEVQEVIRMMRASAPPNLLYEVDGKIIATKPLVIIDGDRYRTLYAGTPENLSATEHSFVPSLRNGEVPSRDV